MIFAAGFTVRRVGLLRRTEPTKVDDLVVPVYLGLPFVAIPAEANALKSGGIVSAHAAIAVILSAVGLAQIDKPVISANAVHMVEKFFRPYAVSYQPCYAVDPVLPPADSHNAVALRVCRSNFSAIGTPSARPYFPAHNAGKWVVV